MKDLRSSAAGATADLSKKDIVDAVKAKLSSSAENENEDAVI